MSENYRKDSLPRKSTAMKILSAYSGGVANLTEGVEYTAFGRDKEVLRFNQTLKKTQTQSGRMEAYVGPYGVGKSFVLALFQNLAIKKGFVVMSADITKNTWFSGTGYEKQGIQLYRELIKNTAIKGKMMNAFDTILEKWYSDLHDLTSGSLSDIMYEFDNSTFVYKDLPHYADIRAAILTRFTEIATNANTSKAMDYFLANITKKSDAVAIGARDYIREGEWFPVLNTWSHLFVAAGYKGLILLFDQVDFLLNLQKANRQQNYEALLTMWNSVNQGRTEYLSVELFAADRFVDDDRKGTQTYKALDDRLLGSHRLETLPPEEMVGLLKKLNEIHEYAYGWESGITDQEISEFVETNLKNTSISGNCIRPISIAWIKKLDDRQIGVELQSSDYQNIVKSEGQKTSDDELDVGEEKTSVETNREFPDDE